MASTSEKPVRFGIELLAANQREDLREWVPLSRSKSQPYRFDTRYQADQFIANLRRSQPHLELRSHPID